MFVVVAYDIADNRRRRRLGKVVQNYGRRVQRSVFECHLTSRQMRRLRGEASRWLGSPRDRLDFFVLCANDLARCRVDGVGHLTQAWAYRII